MAEDNYNLAQADLRIVSGEQGSGKSTLATALIVDDCYSHLTGIINTDTGEYRKAQPLNENEIKSLESKGITYHLLKHIRVFSNVDDSSRIVVKPKGWVIDSPIRVFTNYQLFGIRHKLIGAEDIIESINDDTITDAWLALDESVFTDKQDSMTSLVKMVAKFMAQARRRMLHVIIIAQEASMIATRFILFSTTRIECSYDEDTYIVDYEVSNNSKVMQSSFLYAPDYWKFFKTREIVKQPQYKVDKILTEMYKPSKR
ncbi:MAG: hypothetical protein WC364_15435 [Eubacteriales bacterium]|jgi:energy-coupling factor transporter ATP-binding protein EcfA2